MFPQWTPVQFKTYYLDQFSIPENSVVIWKFDADSPFPNALDLLNTDEKKQALSFYKTIHQERFTKTRAFVKWVLSQYINNLRPSDCLLIKNEYGKPSLGDFSKIKFNISHSENYVLFILSSIHDVGIDIEVQIPRPYDDMASQKNSLQEIKCLLNTPQHLKMLKFFNIWSQKEAFIKACGMGLSYPTQQFTVPSLPHTASYINDILFKRVWKVIRFTPHFGFSGAVCMDTATELSHFYHLMT